MEKKNPESKLFGRKELHYHFYRNHHKIIFNEWLSSFLWHFFNYIFFSLHSFNGYFFFVASFFESSSSCSESFSCHVELAFPAPSPPPSSVSVEHEGRILQRHDRSWKRKKCPINAQKSNHAVYNELSCDLICKSFFIFLRSYLEFSWQDIAGRKEVISASVNSERWQQMDEN